jgi:hypothetical protein
MSSYYVKRMGISARSGAILTKWTGPIRSPLQAEREAQAWRAEFWEAEVLTSSPSVKSEVRAWEKANAPNN